MKIKKPRHVKSKPTTTAVLQKGLIPIPLPGTTPPSTPIGDPDKPKKEVASQ